MNILIMINDIIQWVSIIYLNGFCIMSYSW